MRSSDAGGSKKKPEKDKSISPQKVSKEVKNHSGHLIKKNSLNSNLQKSSGFKNGIFNNGEVEVKIIDADGFLETIQDHQCDELVNSALAAVMKDPPDVKSVLRYLTKVCEINKADDMIEVIINKVTELLIDLMTKKQFDVVNEYAVAIVGSINPTINKVPFIVELFFKSYKLLALIKLNGNKPDIESAEKYLELAKEYKTKSESTHPTLSLSFIYNKIKEVKICSLNKIIDDEKKSQLVIQSDIEIYTCVNLTLIEINKDSPDIEFIISNLYKIYNNKFAEIDQFSVEILNKINLYLINLLARSNFTELYGYTSKLIDLMIQFQSTLNDKIFSHQLYQLYKLRALVNVFKESPDIKLANQESKLAAKYRIYTESSDSIASLSYINYKIKKLELNERSSKSGKKNYKKSNKDLERKLTDIDSIEKTLILSAIKIATILNLYNGHVCHQYDLEKHITEISDAIDLYCKIKNSIPMQSITTGHSLKHPYQNTIDDLGKLLIDTQFYKMRLLVNKMKFCNENNVDKVSQEIHLYFRSVMQGFASKKEFNFFKFNGDYYLGEMYLKAYRASKYQSNFRKAASQCFFNAGLVIEHSFIARLRIDLLDTLEFDEFPSGGVYKVSDYLSIFNTLSFLMNKNCVLYLDDQRGDIDAARFIPEAVADILIKVFDICEKAYKRKNYAFVFTMLNKLEQVTKNVIKKLIQNNFDLDSHPDINIVLKKAKEMLNSLSMSDLSTMENTVQPGKRNETKEHEIKQISAKALELTKDQDVSKEQNRSNKLVNQNDAAKDRCKELIIIATSALEEKRISPIIKAFHDYFDSWKKIKNMTDELRKEKVEQTLLFAKAYYNDDDIRNAHNEIRRAIDTAKYLKSEQDRLDYTKKCENQLSFFTKKVDNQFKIPSKEEDQLVQAQSLETKQVETINNIESGIGLNIVEKLHDAHLVSSPLPVEMSSSQKNIIHDPDVICSTEIKIDISPILVQHQQKSAELLQYLFTVIPKDSFLKLFEFFELLKEKERLQFEIGGSLIFKLIMIYFNQNKEIINSIEIGDIDTYLSSDQLSEHEFKAFANKSIDEILCSAKLNEHKFANIKKKISNTYFANYGIKFNADNAQADLKNTTNLPIDLTVEYKGYRRNSNLIPITDQRMCFSKQSSNKANELSIQLETDKYIIIKGSDNIFELCANNIFSLNQLPDPIDKDVTGYFDRLYRATIKANKMTLNVLAKVALSQEWQQHYLMKKIMTQEDVCAKEFVQLYKNLRHHRQIIKKPFECYIRALLLKRRHQSLLFKDIRLVERKGNVIESEVAAEEQTVGKKILNICDKMGINKNVANIVDILFVYFEKTIQLNAETADILNELNFVLESLLNESNSKLSGPMTVEEIHTAASRLRINSARTKSTSSSSSMTVTEQRSGKRSHTKTQQSPLQAYQSYSSPEYGDFAVPMDHLGQYNGFVPNSVGYQLASAKPLNSMPAVYGDVQMQYLNYQQPDTIYSSTQSSHTLFSPMRSHQSTPGRAVLKPLPTNGLFKPEYNHSVSQTNYQSKPSYQSRKAFYGSPSYERY